MKKVMPIFFFFVVVVGGGGVTRCIMGDVQKEKTR